MDKIVKIGVVVFILVISIAVAYLKPIVMHEKEYKVVTVNLSEQPITSIIISGAGVDSGKIGPINPGQLHDFFFQPIENGSLEYSIMQNEREIKGVINDMLKIGDTGEIYVQVGEMFKVKIEDKLTIPE